MKVFRKKGLLRFSNPILLVFKGIYYWVMCANLHVKKAKIHPLINDSIDPKDVNLAPGDEHRIR
jgi:hypothetical protein